MPYSLSDRRIQTMLERVGEAKQLINDQRYLPFYRSAQIKLEKMDKADEWAKMIETAKEKTDPAKYFWKLCKMVKDGTYNFAKKVKQVTGASALYLHDKLVKYGFGKYQKYWVRKADEFINKNSQAAFIELLEYIERKGLSQRYLATALKNCKPPRDYYKENVLGGAK